MDWLELLELLEDDVELKLVDELELLLKLVELELLENDVLLEDELLKDPQYVFANTGAGPPKFAAHGPGTGGVSELVGPL